MGEKDVPSHPAKFSKAVLHALDRIVERERGLLGFEPRILDPFAGVGRVHSLGTRTVGVEIESEWAAAHPRTKVGDSRHLDRIFRRAALFNMAITSCGYGNRMSDHHNAQERCKACGGLGIVNKEGAALPLIDLVCDKCGGKGYRTYKRNTYKHHLGRDLTEGNSGAMQWGAEYRDLHLAVWSQIPDLLTDEGVFVLNVSDHIRKKEVVPVAAWHRDSIKGLGFRLESTRKIKTPRNRMGQNREARVEHELIYVFRKAS